MRRARQGSEISLAFLDVICCGFGAIILLLMITKENLPEVLEPSQEKVAAELAERQEALNEILGITTEFERVKVETETDLEIELQNLAKIQKELEELTSQFEDLQRLTDEQQIVLAELKEAKQNLTAEMIRLLGEDHVRPDQTIGGIPVDSEYIIFVIDTSGSMQLIWGWVREKFVQVLNIYPEVKGIQIMNDMGELLFRRDPPGSWLPDTPSTRDRIITRMNNWQVHSNSSPVEGVTEAIETYYDPKKRISIYVFGDDFTGSSVEWVVDYIDTKNVADTDGNRRVRVHAVGFPNPIYIPNGVPGREIFKLSSLMRELTVRNNGTFVALPRRARR